MSVTIQQAVEAFCAEFGRAPQADIGDSCWLAGWAARAAPRVAATIIRENYSCDPPLEACLVLVETGTAQRRHRIAATDLAFALQFLGCGVEMAGGTFATSLLGPLRMEES